MCSVKIAQRQIVYEVEGGLLGIFARHNQGHQTRDHVGLSIWESPKAITEPVGGELLESGVCLPKTQSRF